MVTIGATHGGLPDYPVTRNENGYVIPDVGVAEIERDARQQMRNQVEFAVRADELGYDYLLSPEHHFVLCGATSPNPVQLHTAIAMETEELRLMQLGNIITWWDPVRLAEQTATLDILSDGRAEVGLGRGYQAREAEVLGQWWGGQVEDDEKNRVSFEEKYEIMQAAWTETFMSYHGHFHHIPPKWTEWELMQDKQYLESEHSGAAVDDMLDWPDDPDLPKRLTDVQVQPKPVQQPHPQIWLPALGPRTIKWAARRGINIYIRGHSFEQAQEDLDLYYETAEAAGWPDHRPAYDGEPFRYGWDEERRRGVVAFIGMFNTEVGSEEAFERWKLGHEFLQSSREFAHEGETAETLNVDIEETLSGDVPMVGTTEEIIDSLAAFKEQCGYEDFFIHPQIKVPSLPHEDNLEQLRAFAEDVAPYFEDEESDLNRA